jgi:3-hydroxyisobutyrate dehydrogenase-like beta-hydroxyacid dehydrogenase
MGSHMALNARKGGHDLIVHDLRREAAAPHLAAGCVWADSPEALARDSEIVLTSLPGPRDVEAVAEGLFKGLRPGSAWFDLSTNSPTVVRRLHQRFAAKGVPFLDAPVSGGPRGAKSGQLALWVGGDRAVFDRFRAVLAAIGDQVRYIGPIGAGSIAKLVHNAAGYAIHCAVAEVFTMGVKAGVEPLALWSAIRQGALGRKRTFERMADQFLQGKFEPPDFALALAYKDVTLATELAREIGVPMRLTTLAHAEMAEAMARGWGAQDSRVFLRLQEERAKVDIKVPAEEIKKVIEREG